MKFFLYFTGAIVIISTLIPVLKKEFWWIRIFDFPRIQIASIGFIILSTFLFVMDYDQWVDLAFSALLIATIVVHSLKFFPYTKLHKHQVIDCDQPDQHFSFSLIVMNVLMSNRNSGKALEILAKRQPDIIVALETDQWWKNAMSELEKIYPYHVLIPKDNTYGMFIYSKLKIEKYKIRYMLDEDVPSIHARLKLPQNKTLYFFAVHPKPPAPGHSEKSTDRDAELIMVGKRTRRIKSPVIVAGDLNDVAWSYTTNLFQKFSQLLDPRIGRGLFNTFNAQKSLMRWPLDHIFHSDHFQVCEIQRLEKFGSDHFPILVKLCFVPKEQGLQEEPNLDDEEYEDAIEKVARAKAE